MPQILSFGERNSKVPKDNFFKTLWERFNSLDKFIRSYIIFAVIVVLMTPVLSTAYVIFNTRASTSSQIGTPASSSPDSTKPINSGQIAQPQSGSLATYPVDQEVLNELALLNDYRTEKGLPILTPDKTLTDIAKYKAMDMATNNYFSHTDSQGRDPFRVMDDYGYAFNTWRGENLGAGFTDAVEAMNGWKGSPGHNENMLGPNYNAVGLYRANNPNSTFGWYWAQEFGGYLSTQVNYVSSVEVAKPTLSPTPTPVPFDFSISNSSSSISISPGETGRFIISMNVLIGGSTQVRFSVSGLPSGASGYFSPSSCTSTCTTNLVVNTYATATTGTRTLTIKAEGGGKSKSINTSLTIIVPKVDLKVQSTSFSPSVPLAGNVMTFSGVTQSLNSGINVSFSTRLRIDIGNNGTWDINPYNNGTGPFSSANGTETDRWSNIWVAQKGTHKFEICTDVTNGVGEANENNNCYVNFFTVK